jgi:hypothetical protein
LSQKNRENLIVRHRSAWSASWGTVRDTAKLIKSRSRWNRARSETEPHRTRLLLAQLKHCVHPDRCSNGHGIARNEHQGAGRYSRRRLLSPQGWRPSLAPSSAFCLRGGCAVSGESHSGFTDRRQLGVEGPLSSLRLATVLPTGGPVMNGEADRIGPTTPTCWTCRSSYIGARGGSWWM